MGRLQLHFAWYMGSYTLLMLASFLLWQAAGYVDAQAAFGEAGFLSQAMFAASDFLIGFSTIAYPLYALIAAGIKHITGSKGLRRGLRKRNDACGAANAAASSL